MRNRTIWLASTLIGILALVGLTGAEPQDQKGKSTQDKKGGPPRGFGGRSGFGDGFFPGDPIDPALANVKLTDSKKKEQAEALVKAYHENLPKLMDLARSDLLLKMGDVLSEVELKTFHAALDRQPGVVEGRGGLSGRSGPRGGFGPGGPGGPGRGFGAGSRGGPGGLERILNELNLSEKKKDTAEEFVKVYQENIRKLRDLAHAELLLKMKAVLSEEEFKTFKTALDQSPGFGSSPFGRAFGRGGRSSSPPPADTSRTADLEKKLDQLQKDIEELRRQIRR